jgi:hypothetical protein
MLAAILADCFCCSILLLIVLLLRSLLSLLALTAVSWALLLAHVVGSLSSGAVGEQKEMLCIFHRGSVWDYPFDRVVGVMKTTKAKVVVLMQWFLLLLMMLMLKLKTMNSRSISLILA